MDDSVSSLFTNWDVPPWVSCVLVLTAAIYTTGWMRIRRTRPALFPPWRLAAFLGGIAAIFVAVASPLDTFSESLLFMHMAQHFVLMSIAPPLIVLGAPIVPMLRGLPRWCIGRILGPIFRMRRLQFAGRYLLRPTQAWLLMNAAYIGWHIPAAYEFALSSEGWHNVEHACFLFTGILFWWPIVAPWPHREKASRWKILPYLVAADIVNTGLSAYLCFSGRLIYPSYGEISRPLGISALNDQVAAGAFMWVFGSLVFLIPFFAITFRLLSSKNNSPGNPCEAGLSIGRSQHPNRPRREAI
jgi:putative membrane protein